MLVPLSDVNGLSCWCWFQTQMIMVSRVDVGFTLRCWRSLALMLISHSDVEGISRWCWFHTQMSIVTRVDASFTLKYWWSLVLMPVLHPDDDGHSCWCWFHTQMLLVTRVDVGLTLRWCLIRHYYVAYICSHLRLADTDDYLIDYFQIWYWVHRPCS